VVIALARHAHAARDRKKKSPAEAGLFVVDGVALGAVVADGRPGSVPRVQLSAATLEQNRGTRVLPFLGRAGGGRAGPAGNARPDMPLRGYLYETNKKFIDS
jgi:hypothetical protein